MFRRVVAGTATCALLAAPATAVFAEHGDRAVEVVPDQYIVLLKNDAPTDTVVTEHKVLPDVVYSHALRGFAGKLNKQQVDKLKKDERVLAVEPDVVVYAQAQTLPTGINRAEGDLSTTAAINGVDTRVNADIAIIDTGIQRNHPDLNVAGGYNCVPKNPRVTDTTKWDDDNGHGTHVAGTAAALDNGIGAVGMAPGARLWSVKVLNSQGSGNLSWIICGIDWVTSRASTIEVANMSLGGTFSSATLDAAITRSVNAGVVYAVAAGNSAADAATFSPANHPAVIAVSAIADFNGVPGGGAAATCRSDVDDTFADFSNYGAVVDVAAPGVCIYSTWLSSGYNTISGTSMASPHVTGAIGTYLSTRAKPTTAAGVAAVKNAVLSSAFAQASASGFTGDPDAFAEPLLNASSY